MSSSHQPYNTPNTAVGVPRSDYQHWLDDAAQMGLILYRMRNDSKRERLLRDEGHAPLRNPPDPVRRTTAPPPPPPITVPPLPLTDPTPRTSALQVPTVATATHELRPLT